MVPATVYATGPTSTPAGGAPLHAPDMVRNVAEINQILNKGSGPIQVKTMEGNQPGVNEKLGSARVEAEPHPPYCWYCRCLYCFNCDRRPPKHVPTIVKLMDCGIVFAFWASGMYHPGGRFKRRLWEALESRTKVSAGICSTHQVRSVDHSFEAKLDTSVAGRRINVRVYEPMGNDGVTQTPRRRLMLYFHGGGNVIGDLADEIMDDVCCKLSSKGNYVVVSANYRKAPEDPFPAAVFDAFDAYRWLSSRPDDFPVENVDFSSVILSGDSSGGNLCLVISTLVRDGLGPDLKPLPFGFPSLRIAHQVLMYPMLFAHHLVRADQPVRAADMPIIPGPVLEFFKRAYVDDDDLDRLIREDRRLCPLIAGFHSLPHTILISAGLDLLHLEHLVALQELIRRNVSVNYHFYPEEPHAFVHFGHLRSKAAESCLNKIIQKIREEEEDRVLMEQEGQNPNALTAIPSVRELVAEAKEEEGKRASFESDERDGEDGQVSHIDAPPPIQLHLPSTKEGEGFSSHRTPSSDAGRKGARQSSSPASPGRISTDEGDNAAEGSFKDKGEFNKATSVTRPPDDDSVVKSGRIRRTPSPATSHPKDESSASSPPSSPSSSSLKKTKDRTSAKDASSDSLAHLLHMGSFAGPD